MALEFRGGSAHVVSVMTTEAKSKLEIALALYRDAKLSPGRAAEMAEMNKWDFLDLAKKRGIFTPYTVEMVQEDFANAHRHQ